MRIMSNAVSLSVVNSNNSKSFIENRIAEFKAIYETVILSCVRTYARIKNVNAHDYEDDILNLVLNKFATGKAVYDPDHERGASEKTFVWRVTKSVARDFFRALHDGRYVFVDGMQIERGCNDSSEAGTEVDSEVWRAFAEQATSFGEEFSKEDVSLLRKQALVRLYRKSGNKKHMEMFARRLVGEESVNELAKEFNETPTNFSVIFTRLKPVFETIVKRLFEEDEDGRMAVFDECEIAFLGQKTLKNL